MAGVAQELFYQSREGGADSSSATWTRRFLVPCTSDIAETYPGVPAYGSGITVGSHKVFADSIRVEPTGDPAKSIVTVAYSNDGRFKFPPAPQPKTDDTYKRYSMNTSIVSRKVPSFVAKVIQSNVNGGPPEAALWERDDVQVEVTIGTLDVSISLTGFNESMRRLINDQAGRIHSFGTVATPTGPNAQWWRLKGARVNNVTAERWEITYSWFSDFGNYGYAPAENALQPNQTNGLVGDLAQWRIFPTLTRYSFEEYVVIPQADEQDVPRIVTWQPFSALITPTLLKSYRQLPGDPIGATP